MLRHPIFPLPPEITRVVLGGGSAVDQQGLRLADWKAARDFALCYGYDVELPHHRAHLVGAFEDAMAFLEEVILEGTGLDIPAPFFELQDPLELLLWASERPRGERARWSCAILRVMHTLLHVDNDLFLRFLPEIQQQIFDRYDRFLVPAEGSAWMLLAAASITAYLYLFNQNWLHTLLFSDYVGLAYLGYLGAAFALLSDIIFNRARITTEILNFILNALGSAVQVVPC